MTLIIFFDMRPTVSLIFSATVTTLCHVLAFFLFYWVPGVAVQAEPRHGDHPEYEDGEGVLVRSNRPRAAVTVHNPSDKFEIELDYEPVLSIEPTDKGDVFEYSDDCLKIDGSDVSSLHLNMGIELDGDYRGEAKKEVKFRHQETSKVLNSIYILI